MADAQASRPGAPSGAPGGTPEVLLTPDGQYRIDASEMGLLGSGAHGVVRIAQNVHTLDYVAVKIMPTTVMRTAIKEVMALTRLNHAHVVQLLSVQVDMRIEKVYVLMELCQGGELFDRIAECGGLDEGEAKRYFVQILAALSHCHDNKVYHRDLKPENILLDAEDNASRRFWVGRRVPARFRRRDVPAAYQGRFRDVRGAGGAHVHRWYRIRRGVR